MFPDIVPQLREQMPDLRGDLTANRPLAPFTTFRVGGPAQVLFRPSDENDLRYLLSRIGSHVPVTVIGRGSNLIVRDGGIPGVVIRFGRGFYQIEVEEEGSALRVGAGVPNIRVAHAAQRNGIAGLSFLCGIPGGIGGALCMNAGTDREIKDVLVEARAVDGQGNLHVLKSSDMGFAYRHCEACESFIFTQALLRGTRGDPEAISGEMRNISEDRERKQPVRSLTAGSTFTNPPSGKKAWEHIVEASCGKLWCGGAAVSAKHANFLINRGDARAADLEMLGEMIRERVKEQSGVELTWEVKRIGVSPVEISPVRVEAQLAMCDSGERCRMCAPLPLAIDRPGR